MASVQLKLTHDIFSLHFSDGTSLLFIPYEYKYYKKCTDMYEFYPSLFNVQMFVTVFVQLCRFIPL